MHFKIKADCRRGLRIIDEIPDIGLCRVEGHNGIGKSAAVRLLELCTGAQPYGREPQSWRTLREQLISANVKITGLVGVQSIEIEATPSQWPSDPNLLGGDGLQIVVDGVSRTPNELRRILRVHRLIGHETLTDTLAFQVNESASSVKRWITDQGEAWQRRARLDDLLADAMDLIPAYDLATFHDKTRQANELTKKHNDEAAVFSSMEARCELLAEAKELADQLEDVREQGPSLDAQLQGLSGEISTLDQEIVRIDRSITQIAEADAQDQAARNAFEKAQRGLARREQELRALQTKISQQMRHFGLSNPTEAAERLANLESRLRELVPDSFSPGPAVATINLLRTMISELTDAGDGGLGEEIVIEADLIETTWTVNRLLLALKHQLAAREAQLRAVSDDGADSEVNALRNMIAALRVLVSDIEKLPHLSKLLDSAKARLSKATQALPPSTGEILRALLGEKSTVEARRLELIARKDQIEQAKALLGGGLTRQVLNQRLTKICRDLGVDHSRVNAQHAAIQPRLEAQRVTVAGLSDQARVAKAELLEDLEKIETACGNVQSLSWLPASIRHRMQDSDVTVEERITILAEVATALDGVRTRLDTFTSDVQSLAGSLEAVAAQFRTGERAKGRWVSQVYAWLAEEVRQWFDHEQVRLSLFNGGDNVALDLAAMEVSWTVKGDRQRRPLEAFSSGEQAVAYTRARLARLEREKDLPLNRLIVLDEFGAFISNDSMRSLAAYLKDRRRSYSTDQLLVVLPLSSNYSTVGGAVTAEVVESRKQQLQQRGYFAEEFVW